MDEHSLVALVGFSLKYLSFSELINLSKLVKLLFFKIFSNSFLTFEFFLFKVSDHFFSKTMPFSPASLQESKIFFGTSKGSAFHFNFFLTSLISSSPNGEPCEEAFPDLLGDPKPIIVLQEIIFGLFDLEAFFIALEICL